MPTPSLKLAATAVLAVPALALSVPAAALTAPAAVGLSAPAFAPAVVIADQTAAHKRGRGHNRNHGYDDRQYSNYNSYDRYDEPIYRDTRTWRGTMAATTAASPMARPGW